MELVKVHENYYTFYKIVLNEKKRPHFELLAFYDGHLVASINVSKEASVFGFETTKDFCYNNKKYFEEDLEQAIKIAC